MKFSSIAIPVAASLLLAACNSLDNPVTNLFHHSSDERVYNPQTGEWDSPSDRQKPPEKKSAAVSAAMTATPAPHTPSDTRYWDAEHHQWAEAEPSHSAAASRPRPTPTPTPAPPPPPNRMVQSTPPTPPPPPPVAPDTAPPPKEQPAPSPPPPPRPSRATGVYNASSGKIEWKQSGEYVPPEATPAPKKRWFWPF